MGNQASNILINSTSKGIGDFIGTKENMGGSACHACDKSYCCEYQHEIGIAPIEFDKIEELVTPEQIARARVELTSTATTKAGKSLYRCPFLSKEGKCEIYDERFIVCAAYSTIGTNFSCSPANDDGPVPTVNLFNVFEAVSQDPGTRARLIEAAETDTPSDVLKEFKRRYKL